MHSKRNENTNRDIVRFVAAYSKKFGYPPTVREVGAALGIQSSSTAYKAISACEEDGYIQVDRKISRGLRISSKGMRTYA